MAAEFGAPQWVLGMATYAFCRTRSDRVYLHAGRVSAVWPCWICRAARCARSIPRSPNSARCRADGDRVVFRAGAPDHPASIVMLDLGSGRAHRAEARHRHSRPRRSPPCRLPDQGRERGIPDHRRGDRLRPVLSAAQSRLCRPRRRAAAAAGRSATAGRPRRRRARSTWAFNSGPAAASPCST